jgi:hypothetical protein
LGKSLPPGIAHVFAQNAWVGFPQVDEHQTIERVTEVRIYIESEHSAAQPEVLT